MSSPMIRVLALLELLQRHDKLSGSDLAERLQVDRRTVRRYISILEEMGIPVMTEQGRYGGYRLVAGFKLPPMMFSEEEATVLALGLMAVEEGGMTARTLAVDSAEAKLYRVMPDALRFRINAIRDNAQIINDSGQARDSSSKLLALTEAAQALQRVCIQYPSRDGSLQRRELDPYGLVFRWRQWYVCGFCHLRQAMRTFRLDRLVSVRPLAMRFERPAEFNAAKYLEHSMNEAWRQHPVEVLLHCTYGEVAECMTEMAGMLEKHEEGLRLNTSTDSYHWFAWWLIRLDVPFTILGPQALREAMREHANRLLMSCAEDSGRS